MEVRVLRVFSSSFSLIQNRMCQDQLLAGAKDFLSLAYNLVQGLKCPKVKDSKSIKQTLADKTLSRGSEGFITFLCQQSREKEANRVTRKLGHRE